ncbi:hypothetical protein HPB50_024980 [Hyalomma asiaticum]|uniref:Uncharacterized protein n=1 Tax=Hyalomma asiaticum TaxID=266040 RepID=A0ACB7TQC0_HYAAI|nr:hypothetical protein HPB50_024980 [Hyalomma asiaticum]
MKTESSGNGSGGRATRANENRGTEKTSRLANCFMHSTGTSDREVDKRPVRVRIESGANVLILGASAFPDDVPTHAWVSREEVEVLSCSVHVPRELRLST